MSRRRRASVWKGAKGVVRRALVRGGMSLDEASEAAQDKAFVVEARRQGVSQAVQRRSRRRGD